MLGDGTVRAEEDSLRELAFQGGSRETGDGTASRTATPLGEAGLARGEEQQEVLGVSGEHPGVGGGAVRTPGSRPWLPWCPHARLPSTAAPVSECWAPVHSRPGVRMLGSSPWPPWVLARRVPIRGRQVTSLCPHASLMGVSLCSRPPQAFSS